MRARLVPVLLALSGLLVTAPGAADAARNASRTRRAKEARRAAQPRPPARARKPARAQRLAALRPTAGTGRRITIGPHGNPLTHLPPGAPDRLVIGVMAGAGVSPRVVKDRAFEVGREIATRGHVTLSGAAPDLPDDAVRGARSRGGLSIGISPFRTLEAHEAAGSPADFDVLQFTSLPPALAGQNRPNFMGREIDNIVRSDAILIIGGRTGTLGELAIAFEERRPIGVLTGTGGMADIVKDIVAASTRAGKPPGAPVLYDKDPQRLVRRLVRATHAFRESGAPRGPLGDNVR
jgi:predicted Rossmann-fold nucleotide-binding protein